MKYTITLASLLLLASFSLFAQDSLKTNPIIYADFELTPLVAGQDNIQVNFSVNYQLKNSLLTFRFLGLGNFDERFNTAVVPAIENNLFDPGLLYGYRAIRGGHSFSVSGGLSLDHWVHNVTFQDQHTRTDSWYMGVPFELNYIWFRAKKRRTRIYGLIPVGKPGGYGASIGFKVAGDVSQRSFISFGVVFGMGYYKHY
jgi:hypothetical protein